jgi:FkbM family methyltransferase
MSLRDGLHSNYQLFGLPGVVGTAGCRIFGWPREITVQPTAARYPIHLRLRTSDVSLYSDVLLGQEYLVDLPGFHPETIVDVGANNGMSAVFFANTYPEARIIAVEPEHSNYAMLLKNTSEYSNVTAVNAALWNEDGYVNLGLPEGAKKKADYHRWAFQVAARGSRVRAVRMETLLAESGIEKVDLLKIDIEGAEKEVFQNCPWIDRVSVIMVEIHERMRVGCENAVASATRDFRRFEHGETTVFVRPVANR